MFVPSFREQINTKNYSYHELSAEDVNFKCTLSLSNVSPTNLSWESLGNSERPYMANCNSIVVLTRMLSFIMHVYPCIVQFDEYACCVLFSYPSNYCYKKSQNFSNRPLFVKFTLFAFRTALIHLIFVCV